MNETRAEDETLLQWIKARCRGISPSRIAAEHDVSLMRVLVQTDEVRSADQAHCSEASPTDYWPCKARSHST